MFETFSRQFANILQGMWNVYVFMQNIFKTEAQDGTSIVASVYEHRCQGYLYNLNTLTPNLWIVISSL